MAEINVNQIASVIKRKIEAVSNSDVNFKSEGIILSVYDGVCLVYGLKDAVYGEMVKFSNGADGLVLNLETDTVGVLAISTLEGVSEGDKIYCTGKVLSVPVGEGFLGRVVDALGNPLDGKGAINASETLPIERVAPGVMTRKSVGQPLLTGYTAIDSMVPIGRGQRELIIGDRQTGKTALAIDTIINQKNSGVFCIYVAIGQKQSTVVNIVEKLREHGVLDNTIVMSASASSTAAMQYISAYSGCAMGEYFRDSGRDALIIYDDLSKHAVAYRQISLLLRRPPGREAYPGDIFYLHSRLLERAARVNEDYVEEMTKGKVKGQTGSLTALPIIETQGGDFSAFVPTNVVSITDGQIFTDADLFNGGSRPAVESGLSVSRVGGAAQHPIIKKLGGGIRLSLAQYREIASFSQFASDLDDTTKKQLDIGEKMVELMKQDQYAPLCTADMALLLFVSNFNYLDKVPTNKVKVYEKEVLSYFASSHKEFRDSINSNPIYNKEIETKLHDIVKVFNSKFA